jgi:hypothetical protein
MWNRIASWLTSDVRLDGLVFCIAVYAHPLARDKFCNSAAYIFQKGLTIVYLWTICWVIMRYCPLKVNRRFGGTYRLPSSGSKNKSSKKPAWRQVTNRAYEEQNISRTLLRMWKDTLLAGFDSKRDISNSSTTDLNFPLQVRENNSVDIPRRPTGISVSSIEVIQGRNCAH